jgi:hypothetical protein
VNSIGAVRYYQMSLTPLLPGNKMNLTALISFAGVLLAFVVSGFILILLGLVSYSKYLSIIFSLPLSFLFVLRIQKDKTEFKQVSDDNKDVRQLLDWHLYQNMPYRYGSRNKAIGGYKYGTLSDFDLIEVLSSPLVILLCFCIAFMTFIDPIYLDIDVNKPTQLLRLFLISIFQLLFFFGAFDGLILFFFKNKANNRGQTTIKFGVIFDASSLSHLRPSPYPAI